jgi:phosphomannomutase/phosphoglucomutase
VKVVLAAGNGTAGRFVPPLLRTLGCEVVELDCTPDWEFRRYNPNPEDIKFLESISEATRENQAEVGIGIDGDGDRIGVVDDQGREVFSDKLGLLMARWICPANPGRSVVIDVKSTGLFYDDPILRESGAQVITWKTGHSYIKAKVAEANALAGFEKSGHWFFNQPLGRGYDDAVLSSVHLLRMLVASNGSLSALVDSLPKTWQSPTLGPYCADDAKYAVVEDIARQYERARAEETLIGGRRIKEIITVNGARFRLEDDSWGLVRASSNKPALAVVAESRTSRDQLYDIVEDIQGRLARTGQVGEYHQAMPPR